MGEGTLSNNAQPIHQTTTQRNLSLGLDVPLLLVILVLVVFGLLMVYSASGSLNLLARQVEALVVGGVFAVILSRIDYHRLRRLIIIGGIATWLLLLVVLIIGDTRWNAARTILSGSVQPSELAKPVLIIYLAFWLSSKQESLHKINFGLVPMGAIIGTTAVLIILQPDFSAAFTLFVMGILLFFLAGGKLHQTLIVILIVIVMAWLAVSMNISSTITARVKPWLAGLSDPMEGPEQIKRSLEGIVRGGLLGVGIGKSDLQWTGLPVASRDSIFVIVAHETGSLFSSLIILMYLVIAWRGWVIAQRAKDQLGALLASGLTTWIAFEALLNVGMIVGLVPVAGNALPFISAGGSNLACSIASIGIVMSIVRSSVEKEATEKRNFSAVVNLRRGDGGRGVSRTRRSSGSRQ
jgi:cell division protein FtsW